MDNDYLAEDYLATEDCNDCAEYICMRLDQRGYGISEDTEKDIAMWIQDHFNN